MIKKYLLINFVIIVGASVLLTVFLYLSGLSSGKLGGLLNFLGESNGTASLTELPKANILVYTRCFGGRRQPDGCYLYIAELYKPWSEKVVYTFEFPPIDDDDFKQAFTIKVHGISGQNAVYSQEYEEEGKKINILGLVDLATGATSIVYNDSHFGVSVDSFNKKVYYSTPSSFERPDGRLIQFDIPTKQARVLLANQQVDEQFAILYADETHLFGGFSAVGPSLPWSSWTRTLDLKNGTILELEPKQNARFSGDGKNVAYVLTEQHGGNQYNILKIQNIGTGEERELYKTESAYKEINFNASGTVLTAKLVERNFKEGTLKSFWWLLIPPPHISYKERYVLEPTDLTFKWVTYKPETVDERSYSPVSRDAFLYQSDGAWFLREGDPQFEELQNGMIKLYDYKKAILIDAENVFLLLGLE